MFEVCHAHVAVDRTPLSLGAGLLLVWTFLWSSVVVVASSGTFVKTCQSYLSFIRSSKLGKEGVM